MFFPSGKEMVSLRGLESSLSMHQIAFKQTNQRKVRKNVRKARAAGFSNPHNVSMKWRFSNSKYKPHSGNKQFDKAEKAFAKSHS